MKKLKTFLLTLLFLATVPFATMTARASEIDTINDPIMTLSNDAILLDYSTFSIKADGSIVYDESNNVQRLSDIVTGSMSYYYLGKDSKNRPTYQMVMSIVSQTNLKSSVLSTKAEGVTTWHDNSVNHSGKNRNKY